VLLLVLVAAGVVVSSDGFRVQLQGALEYTSGVIREYPLPGAALFVLVSALSAMLMFVSSVVLVPVGIDAWGEIGCLLLLWAGWFLGGLLSYGIGRRFGRSVVARLMSERELRTYEERMSRNTGFVAALLVQLAFPSDVVGYVFGALQFPRRVYLAALICAELPYAAGTVFLGAAVLQQRWTWLLGGLACVAIVLVWQWRMRRRT
jgi:uncharacterized membrane protein YdjX (TVP38/TMEM64 family)